MNPTRATASMESVQHWTVSVVSSGAMVFNNILLFKLCDMKNLGILQEVYLEIANVLSSSTLRDPPMDTADRITTKTTSVVIPSRYIFYIIYEQHNF